MSNKKEVVFRKTYNYLYSRLLYIYNIGIITIIFNKNRVISKPQELFLPNILKDLGSIKKIESQLGLRDMVSLGFFDAHGFVVSDYNLQLANLSAEKEFIPRSKFVIELVVLKNGQIAIKKKHKNYSVFFREIFAMSILGKNIAIPAIIDYNLKSKYIIMEYIDGKNLRNHIEDKVAKEKIQTLTKTEEFKTANLNKQVSLITSIEKPYIHQILEENQLQRIKKDFNLMLQKRFIYQDIRYPNLVIYNSKIYWLDFEHCYNHSVIPQKFFKLISNQYYLKLFKFFNV